jgi:hypothetical protein
MKKLFFAAMVTLFIGASSFSASANDEIRSVQAFNASYNPNSTVIWKYTSNFHKASAEIKGIKTDYFYTPDGEFLASSKSFDFDKLPQQALKTLANSYAYPVYALEECIVIENADQELNYYVSLVKANKKIILQIATDGSVTSIAGIKF